MINLAMECPNCERNVKVCKSAPTVECSGCYTVLVNPLYDENGRRRQRKYSRMLAGYTPGDAHEDASDRDVKCGKAFVNLGATGKTEVTLPDLEHMMTTPPEFETDWNKWRTQKYKKD